MFKTNTRHRISAPPPAISVAKLNAVVSLQRGQTVKRISAGGATGGLAHLGALDVEFQGTGRVAAGTSE